MRPPIWDRRSPAFAGVVDEDFVAAALDLAHRDAPPLTSGPVRAELGV